LFNKKYLIEIIELLERTSLNEFKIKENDIEIFMRKENIENNNFFQQFRRTRKTINIET